VLSPLVFNIYLEEALKISQKLEQVRKRRELLLFADDMFLVSYSNPEIEKSINELVSLELSFDIRLNMKKSNILSGEDMEEIVGIKCWKEVK
jgi:hypothetical protein